MSERKKTYGADREVTRPNDRPESEPAQRKHSQRTAGTNRDFDETGESENQGHGHPREERQDRPQEG